MIPPLSGFPLYVTLALAVPFLLLALERAVRDRIPAEETGEDAHTRDYYLGFTIGRQMRHPDVAAALRRLKADDLPFDLHRDRGGEKIFQSRKLPATGRSAGHELEAGLLSGVLLAATESRYEVAEETCVEKGAPLCRFVAVRG